MEYFLGQELLEVLIGNGKIKMVEMDGEEKLMKFKIGLLLVLDQLPTLFGITVPKIYIVLVFKEWCVIVLVNIVTCSFHFTH